MKTAKSSDLAAMSNCYAQFLLCGGLHVELPRGIELTPELPTPSVLVEATRLVVQANSHIAPPPFAIHAFDSARCTDIDSWMNENREEYGTLSRFRVAEKARAFHIHLLPQSIKTNVGSVKQTSTHHLDRKAD